MYLALMLSYTISAVINKVASGAGEMYMATSSISFIPLWLALLSLVFGPARPGCGQSSLAPMHSCQATLLLSSN